MNANVPIANRRPIREAGYNEVWLQDQIYEAPSALGLGDLEAVSREKRQSTGGRLDILLKNPEDDSMYEVEVMLGETDETHIIRTIEYWDNEKRRWPQRQHYAVLIAERINRRFFNVIHLLSNAIPIIAIQVSLLDMDGKHSLFFTKVLDTYEEVDDGSSIDGGIYDREFWHQKSPWTVKHADALRDLTKDVFGESDLNYVKNYVAVTVHGNNYLWLHKRKMNKSLLGFRVSPDLQDEAESLLDEHNVSHVRKPKKFLVTVDSAMIQNHREMFVSLAKLMSKTWNPDG